MQQQRNKARTPEAVTRCQLWRQMKLPAVMMQGGGEGLGGEGGGKVGVEPVKVAAMRPCSKSGFAPSRKRLLARLRNK